MSMSGEMILLKRFVAYGDAQAFSQIVRAHAGLVYGVCLRILGDKDRAADATQETFFHLLQKAKSVETSIPAWLHKVATRRAFDMIRSDSARRRSEAKYAQHKEQQAQNWQDIAPHVDQALNALDEKTCDLLIQYYFENRSMTDIASEKGVSQPTVSRQIEAGRTQLREEFRKKGIIVLAGALGSLLTQNAAQAAPTAVLAKLAKITLLGTKITMNSASSAMTGQAANTTRTTVSALSATVNIKFIVAAAIGFIAITGGIIYKYSIHQPDRNTSQLPLPQENQTSSLNATSPAASESRSSNPSAHSLTQQSDQVVNGQSPSANYDHTPANESTSPQEPLLVDSLEQASATQSSSSEEPPSPHETVSIVREFFKAIAAGDYDRAIGLGAPNEFNREGLTKVKEAFNFDNLRITEAYLGQENAAVLTNLIPVNTTTMQIGCSLRKSDDLWLIRDVDMLIDSASVQEWLSGFNGVEPDAECILRTD